MLSRMGWLARALSVATVAAATGCAALAGLGDPAEDLPDGDALQQEDASTSLAPPPPDGSPPPTTNDASSPDASGDADAAVDAAPDGPPVCTKKANDQSCEANTECCSGKCREDKRCKDGCTAPGANCNPLSSTECCVGFYCDPSTVSCAGCIASGNDADRAPVTNVVLPHSCCSRALMGGTAKCL